MDSETAPASLRLKPQPGATRAVALGSLIMSRAALVVLVTLALSASVAWFRMSTDADTEGRGALALAAVLADLDALQNLSDDQALARLRSHPRIGELRHLVLRVKDEQGRVLFQHPADAASLDLAAATSSAISASKGESASPAKGWQRQLARPGGGNWLVLIDTSPDSERREATTELLVQTGIIAAGIVLMLAVMATVIHRALRSVQPMMSAVADLEQGSTRQLHELPKSPVLEFERLGRAMRHLAETLDEAQTRRQQLARQVLSLQEDERHHLARELHDEFGQRLTALRADAAWLARRLHDGVPAEEQAELLAVARGMGAQCEQIQQDIRQVLQRLKPLDGADAAQAVSAPQLINQLQALVAGWGENSARSVDGQALRVRFHASLPPDLEAAQLPGDLALTLYRISQEALTNVARHAQARQAELSLRFAALDGMKMSVDWQVLDDGVGIDDVALASARGNGLAGLRERAWACGADVFIAPMPDAQRVQGRAGLMLRARFECEAAGGGLMNQPSGEQMARGAAYA